MLESVKMIESVLIEAISAVRKSVQRARSVTAFLDSSRREISVPAVESKKAKTESGFQMDKYLADGGDLL